MAGVRVPHLPGGRLEDAKEGGGVLLGWRAPVQSGRHPHEGVVGREAGLDGSGTESLQRGCEEGCGDALARHVGDHERQLRLRSPQYRGVEVTRHDTRRTIDRMQLPPGNLGECVGK